MRLAVGMLSMARMMGRGRINEERKDAGDMARLLHAVWAVNHYPRCLERLQDHEIADVEDAVVRLLDAVRAQRARAAAAKREPQPANWTVSEVLAPEAATALGWDASLSIAEALDKPVARLELDSLPLLKPSFCEFLISKAVDTDGFPKRNLRTLGFGWLCDLLLKVASANSFGHDLDFAHAYVVEYGASSDRDSLVPHTDDAEVTLNIQLSDQYEGGQLLFGGRRGDKDEYDAMQPAPPRPVGTCTFHRGRQLHAVSKVTSGTRRVLIAWTRSSSLRQKVCPCCWMNRRYGDHDSGDCICGPAWTDL